MSATAKSAEKRKREVEDALNEMIVDEIRQTWRGNTLAWFAVVAGAFLLNLLLLVLIAGM